MKLENLRKKVNLIDSKILELLSERMATVSEINKIKKRLKLPIKDTKREEQIFDHVTNKSRKLNLSEKFIKSLFKTIISESKRLQSHNI